MFFRRLGVKWMILIGMVAWVLRYALFAIGAPEQCVWMLFMAVALHGVCYDFFFVTGFIYADKAAPVTARSQVQSMLVFFTQGVGMYFGYWLADLTMQAKVPGHAALEAAIKVARGEETLTFAQQLGRMFSVGLPKVDAGLMADVSAQWKTFWLIPSGMAAAVACLFFLAFWDRSADPNEGSRGDG
jgi:hypothetical protein